MRLLMIAPQPFFTPRGTPLSVYYRALIMSELGVQIDLLTYGQGEDVDLPNVRIIRIPALPGMKQVKIGPSFAKAVLDVLMLLWTIGLLLRHRYRVVHAHEESVFWCRFLKPIFRFRLIYDMHSSLPQQLTNFKFTTSRLLIRLFEWLENSSLRHSDAVITICPDLEKHALGQGVSPQRHWLIENSIFDDVRLKHAPESMADEEKFDAHAGPVVVYAGTFESYQGLDLLIHGFALVHRQAPDAQLLMVGGSPGQVEQMRKLASEAGLDGACTFAGAVPKARARQYTEQADVLVSPRREGTNTPLKVYEQIATGKPLVATNIYSHTQVLSDEVCFLVEPTPQGLAEGLLAALTDTEQAKQRADAARTLYEKKYARHAYRRKMQQLLDLIGKAGQR